VVVQMVIGMGKVEVVALSNLIGSLVNLPLSFYLTRRYGVSGVIWGTVLTTLFSNLLIPGIYVFRVLEIKYLTFFKRTLSAPCAGALALIVACYGFWSLVPPNPSEDATGLARVLPFLANMTVGSIAYGLGYIATPAGRGDVQTIARKVLPGRSNVDA
jgi:O-antigen/teichoic acid export membrane protein